MPYMAKFFNYIFNFNYFLYICKKSNIMWDKKKYIIYNDGRVWSIIRNKFLKPMENNCGYQQVYLRCIDGKTRWFKVHRLVAEMFIPNPNNLPEVNHKNEKKEDNSVENLEWCDRSYNINYGLRNAKIKVKKDIAKPKEKKEVYQFSKDGDLIGIYNSPKEASEKNGYNLKDIYKCLSGKRKTHHNYLWRYV